MENRVSLKSMFLDLFSVFASRTGFSVIDFFFRKVSSQQAGMLASWDHGSNMIQPSARCFPAGGHVQKS